MFVPLSGVRSGKTDDVAGGRDVLVRRIEGRLTEAAAMDGEVASKELEGWT